MFKYNDNIFRVEFLIIKGIGFTDFIGILTDKGSLLLLLTCH